VAIEVKGTHRVEGNELRPLMAFRDEYKPRQTLVVCNERVERIHEHIRSLPWRVFLRELWEGKIIG